VVSGGESGGSVGRNRIPPECATAEVAEGGVPAVSGIMCQQGKCNRHFPRLGVGIGGAMVQPHADVGMVAAL
jgi:hypothetical protein